MHWHLIIHNSHRCGFYLCWLFEAIPDNNVVGNKAKQIGNKAESQ